jgi:hypothetical protein
MHKQVSFNNKMFDGPVSALTIAGIGVKKDKVSTVLLLILYGMVCDCFYSLHISLSSVINSCMYTNRFSLAKDRKL